MSDSMTPAKNRIVTAKTNLSIIAGPYVEGVFVILTDRTFGNE